MSGFSGFIQAVAQQGFESLLVRPRRAIGDFSAQVVLKERHQDDIEITDHPVEVGAVISDHAFIRPAEVLIQCGWSNSPSASGFIGGVLSAVTQTASFVEQLAQGAITQTRVQEVYEKLLTLHKSRLLFDVYTGKRVYRNMLMKSLVVETDEQHENSLLVTATCREVLLARTESVEVPDNSAHRDPAATGATSNLGSKQLVPAPNFFNPQAGP